jgi:hypothetical protein
MSVNVYFGYAPYSLNNDNDNNGGEIHIYGFDSNGSNVDPWKTFRSGQFKLILQTIPDLPADSVDFVKEQFGGNVEVYTCGTALNTLE